MSIWQQPKYTVKIRIFVRRLCYVVFMELFGKGFFGMKYLYIPATILFNVYGQMILKWRITKLNWSMIDGSLIERIVCYLKLLFDPFVFSGFVSAFIASVFWTMAMSKFEITTAYPFMSLSPAIVFLLGVFILNETFTVGKMIGPVLIILGAIITVKM
jgi:undecaprenyl phosphate-alpha-L-ara4N flippase subunit ArnF